MIERLFKKEGTFAAALFVNEHLTLKEFDEQHLIFKIPIKGLWKSKMMSYFYSMNSNIGMILAVLP